MILKYFYLIFIFSNIFSFRIYAQNKLIDSLIISAENCKTDTARVNKFNKISYENKYIDLYKTIEYANKAKNISIKINYDRGIADATINTGIYWHLNGNYKKAIEYYKEAATIYTRIGLIKGLCKCYNNIGNSYNYLGEGKLALEFLTKELKIEEKNNDILGQTYSLVNIGNVYLQQKEYKKSIEYYLKSLSILEKTNDKYSTAQCINNIGVAYRLQNNLNKALEYYLKSLEIRKQMDNKAAIAESMVNIGDIYFQLKEFDIALDYFNESLKNFESSNNLKSKSIVYIDIASVYFVKKDYKNTEMYFQNSLKIAKITNSKDILIEIYKNLAQLKDTTGKYKDAFQYFKLYSIYKDSVFNETSQKQILEIQTQYDTEKKEKEILLLTKDKEVRKAELLKRDAEVKKQRILIYSFVFGFIIILIFSIVIYRLFVQKRNANVILSQQKEEILTQRDEIEAQRDLVTNQKDHIELIHSELKSSIRYAQRIQGAVLTSHTQLKEIVGDHFILFKPRDVVSGDFYWASKVNQFQIICVADCTGHGVPGAFMSMLGISFLNEIVQKQEISKANQILNHLRIAIINALQQKGVQGEQKDGMDISLLVINTDTNEAQWAGANNPIYIIRSQQSSVNSQQSSVFESQFIDSLITTDSTLPTAESSLLTADCRLFELKGDKMPIAIYPQMKDFTNHDLTLHKGDSVYLFTDGYPDQFGGPKGRKFMYKQFQEILVKNCNKPMNEQKVILEDAFENWGNLTVQIDDITVLGIKI